MTKPTKWHVGPAKTQISWASAQCDQSLFRWFCHEAALFVNYEHAQGGVDIWHSVLSPKGRSVCGANQCLDNMFSRPTLPRDLAELKLSKLT